MHSLSIAAAGILLVACSNQAKARDTSALDRIGAIAAKSKCASIDWKNRGRAPTAYIRGMAIVFARAVCQQDRADVRVVSAARGKPGTDHHRTDALTWYHAKFDALGMANDQAGVDTLRHAYALLIGLGMRESSGKHCVGRDKSANFSSANSAEAGIFQTSWGAHKSHPTLPELYHRYSAGQSACLLATFRQNVKCTAWDAKTWGQGTGAAWQKLTKSCPAFATEYAAVLIRTSGGEKGEFGPLRRRKVELKRECDSMLSEVQSLVQSNPQICSSLR